MSVRLRRRLILLVLATLSPLVAAACIVAVSSGVQPSPLDKNQLRRSYFVTSPVRAHLVDGSTVVYAGGLTVSRDSIYDRDGSARRIGPLNEAIPLRAIPLDSVAGLEAYRSTINPIASTLTSTLGTAAGVFGGALLAVAIFGSCPTIYYDSAGTDVLQAEVFARRISPLLEAREVDLLSARPDNSGRLVLEVRNEALETHYINHFELLEVRHPSDTRVIPDEHGKPLAVGAFASPTAARDRAGRDLRAVFAKADGDVFLTDSATLFNASGDDPRDYVDLTFARPPGDSAVIGLRLRNSLLNTVLLYDLMLTEPGARSIDWMTRDMRRITPMLQFGRWYRANFGLRVAVYDGKRWRDVERHPTYGPVAWREAATAVPVLERDSLRMRLTFTADEWRIDWIGVASEYSRRRPRLIGLDSVRATNDSIARLARQNIRSADDRYLETGPGDRFWIVFNAGPAPRDSARTFLLASQGYYTEWLRGRWVKAATDTSTFKPSAKALDETLRRWAVSRDSVERAFFATKIPVRSR